MLSLSNITKNLSGKPIFQGLSFQINPGEKVGLVGPNGAGKTTIFRLIIGEEKLDGGQITFPDKFKLAYFSQKVGEMAGKTALQEVIEGDAHIIELQTKLNDYEQKLCDPNMGENEMMSVLEKMGEAQTEFEKRGGYDLTVRAEEILTGLGISPEDHHKKTEEFSGGWKMRIALAKVLVIKPDLILMDEPTNYLDLETILWLEDWLKNFEGAVLMTTHDRDFMNNVVKKVIEVFQGKATPYAGDYDFYMKEREIRRDQLKAQFQRQQDMLAKEEEFIAKFKARASHAAQVQSRVKKLDKIERVELPAEEEKISFQFQDPPRGSDEVVITQDLSKCFEKTSGDELRVFENLDMTVKRAQKIAVVGVNGAGKSTLLKCLAGELKPSRGQIKIGPSIKIGYFSQYSLEVLNAENTVLEEMTASLPHASDGQVRNLLAAFLFKGDDVQKKIKLLSGGEKSRLVMAVLLAKGNNFLILDEPTNHLDIQSREILLDALKRYSGTILFVSHDRHFLHELAENVYEVAKGEVIPYPGNYQYYLDKIS